MKTRCLIVGVGLWTCLTFAETLQEQGRAILEKNQQAVVTVKVVLNQSVSMAGRETMQQEDKSEITGTVIDENGLTVVSLSATDPTEMMSKMMGSSQTDMKFDSNVSDLKILLPGGKELPAKVVLRDKDLDLAFIRPLENPAQPLAFIDLKQDVSAQLLDDVVVLNRLGQVANRQVSISQGGISTIIERPRKYYVMDHEMSSLAIGTPVFTRDGQLLGINAMRSATTQSRMGVGSMFSGMSNLGFLPIVVPALQVYEVAQQASQEEEKVKPIEETKKP